MRPTSADRFPRSILAGAAILVTVTMGLAAVAPRGDAGDAAAPVSEAVASIDLRFEDRTVGGVAVVDAADDRVVANIEPGEGGFVRGVLRALVRERRLQGIGPEQPFRLTRWADQRLSLADPATGTSVYLEAFGRSQVQAFAQLMDQAGPGR